MRAKKDRNDASARTGVDQIYTESRELTRGTRSFQLEIVRGAKVHGHGIWSRNLHASRRHGVDQSIKALGHRTIM
jgi:hypothetical protein